MELADKMNLKRQTIREIDSIFVVIKGDKFDRLVRDLQDLLLHEWEKTSKQAIADVITRLAKGKGKITDSEMEEIYQGLSNDLGIKFANRMANPMFEIETDCYGHSQRQLIGVKPSFNVVDQRAIRALEEHNIYWVKNQWDNNLAELTYELGNQIIQEGIPRIEAGKLFATELADKYDAHGTKYWEGFANHVVTRSRSLGQVEAMVKAEITRYEIRAVLDHRTTPICREMHGRIFEVADAVKLRDSFINAKSPEEVKEFAPWQREFDVQDLKTDSLPLGVKLPPYHWNCRTRTVIYKENEYKVDKHIGSDITDKEQRRRLDAYSKEEYANWMQAVLDREKITFDRKDLGHDFKKHAWRSGINFKTAADYEAYANEAIKNADKITAKIYEYSGDKSELQFCFYSTKSNCMVIVDRGMRVRGCYFQKDVNITFDKLKDRELWLQVKKKN